MRGVGVRYSVLRPLCVEMVRGGLSDLIYLTVHASKRICKPAGGKCRSLKCLTVENLTM